MQHEWVGPPVLLALFLSLAACGYSTPHLAPATPADSEQEEPGALVSPKLLKCPGLSPPLGLDANERVYRVGLRFVVLEDGTVDAATITPALGRGSNSWYSAPALDEAKSIAQGCLFSPPTRNGVPAAATAFRVFRVLGEVERFSSKDRHF